MLWPTLEFVLGVSLVLTLLVGGHEVAAGRITAGQFTSYMVFMVQLTFPHARAGLRHQPVSARHRVGRPHRRTAALVPSIMDEAGNGVAIDAIPRGDIEFRNLTFGFGKGPEILRDVNLSIPAGSSLAIVGPTGAGKTTLVNLIPRLLDAAAGQVLIDGLPIREWAARLASPRHRFRASGDLSLLELYPRQHRLWCCHGD